MEGGKLSTRNGNVIYAEEILHESINKIYEIIEEKNPDLPDKETFFLFSDNPIREKIL